MSRLPEFFAGLSPLREILHALDDELEQMRNQVDVKNVQTMLSGEDRSLSMWEDDYRLPHTGDSATRLGRIRTALAGAQTLTRSRLEALALEITGADRCMVEERFETARIVLRVLFDDRDPERLSALQEIVERYKPAHLQVNISTTLPSRDLAYHGTAAPLTTARSRVNAVSLGQYALLGGGGRGDNTSFDTVDVYDTQLVHSNPVTLLSAQNSGAAAVLGEHALFAGGFQTTLSGGIAAAATVFDTELTVSAHPELDIPRTFGMSAASTRNHMLFGTGRNTSWALRTDVDAIDRELVRSAPDPALSARAYYASASLNGMVFFAGGQGASTMTAAAEVYGPELEHLSAPDLSNACICLGAAAVRSQYVLFAGGQLSNGKGTAVVSAYSPELTRIAAPSLSQARWVMSSGSFEGNAVFAGGVLDSNNTSAATVESYGEDLTHTVLPGLSTARWSGNSNSINGAAAGAFFLFGGGSIGKTDNTSAAVDAYTVAEWRKQYETLCNLGQGVPRHRAHRQGIYRRAVEGEVPRGGASVHHGGLLRRRGERRLLRHAGPDGADVRGAGRGLLRLRDRRGEAGRH